MENSYLVWAERFELKELTSAANGTYNREGRKESKGAKMVIRSWALDRNINDNNEIYIFDEEKTNSIEIEREIKLKEIAEAKVKDSESSEDKLAKAIAKAMGGGNSEVNEELEELIEEAEELGIVLKGRKTVKSVQAKIDKFKEDNA